jgi:hypothetical protein
MKIFLKCRKTNLGINFEITSFFTYKKFKSKNAVSIYVI